MAHVITINPQIRATQTMTILDPQKELREILYEDMGADIADLFDDIIRDLEIEYEDKGGDDYEAIADEYRNMLVDFLNELQEIIMQKRLNHARLERLCERLNRGL